MSFIPKFLKERIQSTALAGLMGAILAISLGVGLRFVYVGNDVPLGQGLIHWSYDIPFLQTTKRPTEAVIVYLDDESHKALKQPYDQRWDRSLHAKLLERLRAERAKLVVFDIIFSEPAPPEMAQADQLLAQALRKHGPVILSGEYMVEDVFGNQVSTVYSPIEPFTQAAAGWGLIEFVLDPDYGVRQLPYGRFLGDTFIPSIGWKAAEWLGATRTKLSPAREWDAWLHYYGRPGALPGISFHRALNPSDPPPGFFRDKVVFVGALQSTDFTGKGKDEFRTPHSWWTRQFSAGVEIHATAFLNLLREEWLRRVPPTLELILLVVSGAVIGYGLSAFRPWPAIGLAILSALAVAALQWLLFFKARLWFAWLLIVAAQLPAALAWSFVYNTLKLYIQNQLLEQSLSLHLSPTRVKQLLKSPELRRPGGIYQEVSIMFTDIANFSKITEGMDPDDLFKLLNKYFETSLACIHKTHGTVVKLMGDAIFAIWNAPLEQPGHQELACHAALDLHEQLVQFDATQSALPLRTRVGLHTGQAVVGNVGSSNRFDYSAIGDSTNLASRLEGLNKYLGTELLASRAIQKAVEGILLTRLAGHFKFKGFGRAVEVHELIGALDQSEATKPWRQSFQDALHHFQRQEFDPADAAFRHTLELRPKDGPALFYLERIAEYRATPPQADWTGEIDLKEK